MGKKYTIDETTLSAIAEAIRDKTLEKELLIAETNNLDSAGEDGAYANTTILHPGTTYLVTYNNQKYVCESYLSRFGAYCIGNELIWKERYDVSGEDSEFHYENTPFLIVSEMNGNGLTLTPGMFVEWSEWYIETEIEGAEYTVKIEKLLSGYNAISVKDFATEIKNIPAPITLNDYEIVPITINYNLPPVSGFGITHWSSFSVNGYCATGNKLNVYNHHQDVPDEGATGTLTFSGVRNTALTIYTIGMSSDIPFECEVTIEVPSGDGWYSPGIEPVRLESEGVQVFLPDILPGGAPYSAMRLTVTCTMPGQWG